jgi:hypothetical protein
MRNPSRRSRNIGKAKQGYGQNNRLVIPTRLHPSWISFTENLNDYTSQIRLIHINPIAFLTEKPRVGCFHACSVEEIEQILLRISAEDLDGLELIVLRQPKRKEEILSPVWGRYIPYLQIGKFNGSAIVLESLDLSRPLRWKKPILSGDEEEIALLCAEGHTITETKRYLEISSTLESVRQTQLFRTLPHEVGHHVHNWRDENFSERTKREKEDFAERYAREFAKRAI